MNNGDEVIWNGKQMTLIERYSHWKPACWVLCETNNPNAKILIAPEDELEVI